MVGVLSDPVKGLVLILLVVVAGVPALRALKHGGSNGANGNGINGQNSVHLTTKELEKELAKLAVKLEALDKREEDHWDLVAAARREFLDRLREIQAGFDRDFEHLQRVVSDTLQRTKGPRG